MVNIPVLFNRQTEQELVALCATTDYRVFILTTLLQRKSQFRVWCTGIIEAELLIKPGESTCLVGRNGCGKSTLLKVINNEQQLDDGRIINKDVVISRLEQDPPQTVQTSVFEYVAEGLAEVGQMLKDFFHRRTLWLRMPVRAN